MGADSSTIRKLFVALAVALPCLLGATAVEAAPVRKAHHAARPHHTIARRPATASQAFARVAGRRPERRVHRHPPTWLKRSHGTPAGSDHDTAIQNDFSPASVDVHEPPPALQPLELLISVHAQLQSHEGFAHSSPRAPPVRG